ncbi:MAG: YbfB/YjiJ family MFS transporter [Gammaproteobacteria bacterium]|nr:YbfB/YjiJ family MFS transporter [Gammaproteobacteria bacterium]MBU1723539.1 YbfB/YjiJ family MFS transporter [Gammaproteobacteria bacterium]MBU2004097.1 YbfB/YjiJ family MFS transporter [Gammaproteobacteria bacterium]
MTLSKQERWSIAVGMLGLIATFGIARFIYTPLLPLMQASLGFGEDWAGLLASANYVGYLCGALGASFIHSIATKRFLFRLAIVVAALTNIGMGIIQDDTLWLLFRFLSGLASAGGMVIGSGLMMLAVNPRHSTTALGIHFSGVGIGIALGALWVLLLKDGLTWQGLWISTGILLLVLGLPGLLFNQWSLNPHKKVAIDSAVPHRAFKLLITLIALIALAYFCEGVGYVISATFLVSILQKASLVPHLGDYAWVVVGLAAAPSCWLWSQLARRIGDFPALIAAYLVQAVGIVLPVISTSQVASILGALLFGGTFMGIVSMVLMYGGRLGGSRPTRLMGLLTACFGVAQIVGPAAAGWMAEQQGNFNLPLMIAAGVTVVGAALMWLAQRVSTQHGENKK